MLSRAIKCLNLGVHFLRCFVVVQELFVNALRSLGLRPDWEYLGQRQERGNACVCSSEVLLLIS